MKIFIIGMNASGKDMVIKDLESLGIKHGRRFTSLEEQTTEYYLPDYVYYDNLEVNRMFENKAYFFLRENNDYEIPFYEGISLYEYENFDIFAITPDQFVDIPKFDNKTVFVWMDANNQSRHTRYIQERRKYDFQLRNRIESEQTPEFIERLYSRDNVLYFNNEEPERISAIIASLVRYPELLSIYKTRFI